MVLVDLKDSQAYAKVKLLGDTELKIPTQFLLKKNISKRQQDGSFWPDRSTVHNIVIKLNSKLGGTNQTLDKLTTSKLWGPIFQQPVNVILKKNEKLKFNFNFIPLDITGHGNGSRCNTSSSRSIRT